MESNPPHGAEASSQPEEHLLQETRLLPCTIGVPVSSSEAEMEDGFTYREARLYGSELSVYIFFRNNSQQSTPASVLLQSLVEY